jgi:Bacterial SH3 domain
MTKSIIFQRLSATAQFVLGFIIGISLIVGVSGSLVFAYYKKMSILPEKPVFPVASSESTQTIEPLESKTTTEPEAVTIAPEPESKTEPEPEPEPELPANSYYAVVTWSEGLSLRAEPSIDAEKIGGIEFESKIIVLENSSDGQWQRVMLPGNQQEGWIKGGNTERTPD